ncbi:uncharacterized protein [Cicer arietinum]|uniref:Uncharacterized protein LOC101491757 n=1 Tax=Cicer arietinum TaxID=3827 RepID=A0A1S2Z7T9_CICAR|nr:uncharacterized protein LOC101491757 [Cicer arietinum]
MEEINEWQQIEQHPSLESSEWNRVIINEGTTQIVPTTIDSVSDEEDETPTRATKPLDWANEGRKLLKVRFEAMRMEIMRVASKVRNCAICSGAFWSITYMAGAGAATGVLVSLVYMGIQSRRRKEDGYNYLLRHKDEKINQLLLQIAHLNETLSSRRKVPVKRIVG